jgi:N-sulfoglucosamine sulfohydrolase
MKLKRAFLTVLLLGAGALWNAAAGQTPAKPNLLIIIADDATFHELPLYGGKNLKTPNLDRLAGQGMLFRRAYVSMAMCTPCRTEMYTGLYPARSGVVWNHALAKPGTRSIVQHLGDLGYRVGIAGKTHIQPRSVFPFEMVDGFERNCVAQTANYDCKGIKDFMVRDPKQPFCLVVALVVPHAPWTVGDPSHFDPKKLVLAPYLVDTPETRESLARYFAEYEVMDQQIGEILKTLEENGQTGGTLVLYTSEQGGQWPGCKWTNWEEGLHTALIARWPGRIQPGAQTDALVQYADILPTLMEAAGGKPAAATFDGSSFLSVLEGRAQAHRKFAYAMHNNLPEGPPFPIRSVHNGRFHYIRNLTPDAIYVEKHVMGSAAANAEMGVAKQTPYWLSWIWNMEPDPHAEAMVTRYMRRPPEQLYDTQADPFEMTNLANDPRNAGVKAELSAELDRWMREQGDPGASLDTRELQRANKKNADAAPSRRKRRPSRSGRSKTRNSKLSYVTSLASY